MGFRVVYRDLKTDAYYSAPVVRDGVMQAADGTLQPISYVFHDDRVGRLIFSHYRNDEDVAPAAEPDMRLHVEGQGFRALQEAVAKERLRKEAERESARREALNSMNQPNTRKIAESRANATALAQRWNRKRPEPITPPVTQLEKVIGIEETRLQKKAEKAGRDQE